MTAHEGGTPPDIGGENEDDRKSDPQYDSEKHCHSGLTDLGFDSRGRRCAGEIDLENRHHGTTIAEMTEADWAEAARMLRAWDAGWRP
ncbi:hypothetical protein [Amycolatopsis sp. NPDC057786]|uniref:hypothetical protein n=1 Tax=Amycolatopsis sp. NPDC057786 TaxID=3346250 RepID=UPI00366C373F